METFLQAQSAELVEFNSVMHSFLQKLVKLTQQSKGKNSCGLHLNTTTYMLLVLSSSNYNNVFDWFPGKTCLPSCL